MAKEKTTPTSKEVGVLKIKFLLSPTGKFGLGYNVDEEGILPELQATELIEAGYAELVK